jgi:hypothetical protein
MTNDTRAAFEAWWDSDPIRKQFHPDAIARASWLASRRAALAEAAQVCEDGWHLLTRHECAAAIRALADEGKG